MVQVFYEVTQRMLRLYANDSINEEMIEDLEFIDASITNVNIQSQVAPRLLSLGIVELCQNVFRKKAFRKMAFDVNSDLPVGITAVLTSLGCVVNLTDISKDACHRVIEVGFHKDVFKFLNLDSMDPSKVKFCYVHSGLADSAMSLAYNAIQVMWLS